MSICFLLAVSKAAISKLPLLSSDGAFRGYIKSRQVRRLYGYLTSIRGYLITIENKQEANLVKDWLEALNSVVYRIDDLLDESITALEQKKSSLLLQVKDSLSWLYHPFSDFPPINFLIKRQCDILEELTNRAMELRLEYTSDETGAIQVKRVDQCRDFKHLGSKNETIFGRDEDKLEVLNRLSVVTDDSNLLVHAIVGLGGVGKSTLAKLVYDDEWVCVNFDFKLWITMTAHDSDVRQLMENIVHVVDGNNSYSPRNLSLDELHHKVSQIFHGKKYFIVLDNVWNEYMWIDFKHMLIGMGGGSGNVVLVTTRMRSMESGIGATYVLQRLPNDMCWSLFCELVFEKNERDRYSNLAEIGKSIVHKCCGIPLFVKVLGGTLCRIRDERWWVEISKILNSDESLGLWTILRCCWIMLPFPLKACFSYCGVFSEDTNFSPLHLTNYWRAQGLLNSAIIEEDMVVGYEYINDLLQTYLLQDAAFSFINLIRCAKMHNCVYEWLKYDMKQDMDKHLVWGSEFGSISGVILDMFSGIRTFRFGCKIQHLSKSFVEEVVSRCKQLRVLDFANTSVEELPESVGKLKHLRLLNLSGNLAIKSLPSTMQELHNLQTLYLDGCVELQELPQGMHRLVNLRFLSLTSKQSTLATLKLHLWSSLQHLEIYCCGGLLSLWGDSEHLTSLKNLVITDCQALVMLPKSMKYLDCLEELVIHNCTQLDLTESDEGLCGLKSLRNLMITGIRKLVTLPAEVASVTGLQYLMISDCGNLTSLRGLLQSSLASLKKICLYDCPKLLVLPEELWSITALQYLDISGCPHLNIIFDRNTKPHWTSVSHIPDIILNRQWLRVQGARPTRTSALKYCSQQLPWSSPSLYFNHMLLPVTYSKGMKEEEVLEQNSALWKFSRWKILSLVLRVVVRLKTIIKEKYRIVELSQLTHTELEMMFYCCLFSDNYEFERDKLVQLWMAAKFITSEPLEYNGYRLFDFLVAKKLILPSRVNFLMPANTYKVNMKMLTTIASLIPTIREFPMRPVNDNMIVNSYADSWHISVAGGNIGQATFENLKKFSELRTLLFYNCSLLTKLPSDIFSVLKSLTALDLSGSCLKELPSSIGDARELCYVDLSQTLIENLPHTMACLTKLQTLRLKGCAHLFSLPKGIQKLTKLRHLDFDVLGQLSSMPRGIGALVELQTLSAFIVCDEESVRELKHMNNLSGKLCISGLEHVVSFEDAKEAALGNKVLLKKLELRWSDNYQLLENGEQCYNEVLIYLEPHSSLEELQIICFPGSKLPNWIANSKYANLASLTLFKCENCNDLPSLGLLPKLKNLDIIEVNSVQIIDKGFCGNNSEQAVFPMLEMLVIDGMSNLKEWIGFISGECQSLVKLSMKQCPHLATLCSFPNVRSLRHLEVINCPLLERVPEELLSSPLETIAIVDCPRLERRYSKGGADSSKIKHVPSVWIDSKDSPSSDDDTTQDYDLIEGNYILEETQLKNEGVVEEDISIVGSSSSTTCGVIPSALVTPMSEGDDIQPPNLKIFQFSDLEKATNNFRRDEVLGEGYFGVVYKGRFNEANRGKEMVVAVKRLTTSETLHTDDALHVILKYHGKIKHPHIVQLIGYCFHDTHQLLVYEFMPHGSLDNHLFKRGPHNQPLSWILRLEIALGAAKGLAFLHSAETQIIHKGVMTSHILLDLSYNAKLSGFGLVRNGPTGDKSHMSTQGLGNCGFAAPEYVATGRLTAKSDVYSFGVVVLEMITGLRVFDPERPSGKHNLVDWARPFLTNRKKISSIVDQQLVGEFTNDSLLKVSTLVSRCLSNDPKLRPTMEEVVKELSAGLFVQHSTGPPTPKPTIPLSLV